MKIEFNSIGVIHTPFTELSGMPIQPVGGSEQNATIELFDEYSTGLKDLDGFSHIILLYHFHRSRGYKLVVTPYVATESRGVFATRAPARPNAIGLSVVKLNKIDGNILHIQDVDILDGTPLLDIKPYVPMFDSPRDVRTGWLELVREDFSKKRSDDRFK
jgi:tRNA-Thr(GGU) m(6)t(6)A37 methyltransferase TsaA